MLFSSVFSWFGVSLQGLQGSKPSSSTQDVQPAEITESKLAPLVGLEHTEEIEPDDTEETYGDWTDDITNQYYLADRGYYALWFLNGETKVFSNHYDASGKEKMLSIYFDEDRQVASLRDDNLRYERDHKYKLPLYELFEALCHLRRQNCPAMDWIVMDIFDFETLDFIEQYRENNNLGIEADIRLTDKDKNWEILSNTYYYQQASRMIPGRIDKMIIRRQERWIEGTNYPATVAHLIMFSFKSFDSRGQDPPATDPAEIGALEVVGAAIDAVDETEAANLKKQLGIRPEAGADTLDDFAEALPEKSDTEPALKDS
ncbi:hypothetical protein CFIMG_006510RA [Ceratocystis fimbriata CBS 114723]|uniref:Uncharacterized protein n=1 Tax=Ceratocystis fimbriata CBS 114723 TaxID=1035309 RepID=A0A2C5WV85_9PEZI|nr:hypothetical protein CFIMG_006510RA [Ceratocystis fimbriata CBS 114723]